MEASAVSNEFSATNNRRGGAEAAPKGFPVAHKFNDDLLLNDGDLAQARILFPKLLPVLDFPELRETFRRFESNANRAKSQTHRWGLCAILCGVIALLSSALHNMLPSTMPPIGEVVGFAGILLSAGGLWLFNSKSRWLLSRLMTERLRQWHFQVLVRRSDLVRAIAQADDQTKAIAIFNKDRLQLFQQFLMQHDGKLDSLLTSLTTPQSNPEPWTIGLPSADDTGYEPGETFDMVCHAYHALRLLHQSQYADYKLGTAPQESVINFFHWPVIAQSKTLDRCEGFCFVALLGVAAVALFGYAFNVAAILENHLSVFAVCIAIAAFAIRTIKDGLGLPEEIARYEEYRGRTQRLLRDFDQAESMQRRVDVMNEMELTAFDELRHFLTTHSEARFLL